MRFSVRSGEKLAQGGAELRSRLERREAERVGEDQPLERFAALDREARGNRAAQDLPDERRRCCAGCLEQLAQPCQHALSFEWGGDLRATMPR